MEELLPNVQLMQNDDTFFLAIQSNNAGSLDSLLKLRYLKSNTLVIQIHITLRVKNHYIPVYLNGLLSSPLQWQLRISTITMSDEYHLFLVDCFPIYYNGK